MGEIMENPVLTDKVGWDWSQAELNEYIDGNYSKLAPEDIYVGTVAISVLAAYARQHDIFHALPFGTHISAGGVPRGSALIVPLIRSKEEGGFIDVSDLELSTTNATRNVMSQLALGELGIWTPHQQEYAATNRTWDNSFQAAGQLAENHVHTQDMRLLTPRAHHIIAVEYGPESATEDKAEYEDFIHIICNALLPGGILYMAYMRGSEGYEVGGIARPAIPVSVDYVGKILNANGMNLIINGGTDPSNSIRVEGDTHAYTGMGVAVGVRAD
jgi:hypothetical protein